MIHKWEEPCICGKGGAAAVFFSGCSLGCVYCQNKKISYASSGREYDADEMRRLFREIVSEGAECLELVTPSHYAPQIKEALYGCALSVPVVYNIGGYELEKTVRMYMDPADVFLTDFKYGTAKTGMLYSAAADYPEIAVNALKEMYRLTGGPVFGDNGMLVRGIVLRHLVLPGERKDSVKALERAASAVPPEKIILSLMRQYTPGFAPDGIGKLGRRVTSFEYEYVRDAAIEMGFSGYSQDANSATAAYTPDF